MPQFENYTRRLKRMLMGLAETTDSPRIKLECAKLLLLMQKPGRKKPESIDPELSDILGLSDNPKD
jgi:hypothetical protein